MGHRDHPKLIAGNWKMYKTIEQSVAFVKELAPKTKDEKAKVYLAVPFTAIKPAADAAKETSIAIGAQNMHDASEGAFTGEIGAKMLVDAGARFVILGHSERRLLFNENNQFINKKVKRAVQYSLQPILCIGETLQEREAGKTEEVLQKQLIECLDGISDAELKELVIAYEPVWAIGAHQTATPETAQAAHAFCRKIVEEVWGASFAEELAILYGGSAKPENAETLLKETDIDGLLVGGASLTVEGFSKIVKIGSEVC